MQQNAEGLDKIWNIQILSKRKRNITELKHMGMLIYGTKYYKLYTDINYD